MSEEAQKEGEQPMSLSESQTQSTQSTQSPSQVLTTQSPTQSKPQSQSGSSSSSGPTSASQSSSGSGTLSSLDTIPVTLPSVPEEAEVEPWGRLLPMLKGFRSHGGWVRPLSSPLSKGLPIEFSSVGFQTASRTSTCLAGNPSATTSWMTRTTAAPRSSKSTARSTSESTE